MAKRTKSTFERLQKGKVEYRQLSGKQREELERRLQRPDPGLEIIHEDAAGIDVGGESHFAAVPTDRDPNPIREFGSWTGGLRELVDWLKKCRIRTVALQATGVYWIVLCGMLEAAGLEVFVVNAQGTKNVPGRKTDVKESEWLRRLHKYGLLRNSYRPPEAIRDIRDLWNYRERCVQDAARAVQRIQKALTEMNIQLTNALADVTGKTGMAIIRGMVNGERDPRKLAQLRDPKVHASEEEIAHSLEGTWREVKMFELAEVVKDYDHYQEKIARADRLVQEKMGHMPTREAVAGKEEVKEEGKRAADGGEPKRRGRPRTKKPEEKTLPKNAPAGFDMGAELVRLLGVDLRAIDGINIMTAQAVYTEVGPDFSAFPTEGHFASWLGLAPMRSVSGGKVIRHEKKTMKNRLTAALRMGVTSLEKSETYLGAKYRALKYRLGGRKAVKAMARYLACLIYRMMTRGQAWVDRGAAYYEQKRAEREMKSLRKRALAMGMQLVPVTAARV